LKLDDFLLSMTALEIGQAYASGSLDPVTTTEFFLDKADIDDCKHVYIAVLREQAINDAKESANRYLLGKQHGPLDGVPVAVKDLIDIAGVVTTCGSEIRRNAAPALRSAQVVHNLSKAGMVILGKTNLSEFAYSGLGINPHFGTPKNSFGINRVPGGSSSGSAVVVSSGASPCAIGSDTSGSIRIPAAFNGLVGFKPSSNRFDMSGVHALAPTLDTLGPITTSVKDSAFLDAAMRGKKLVWKELAALSEVSFIIPSNLVFEKIETDVLSNFENAVLKLKNAGAHIVTKSIKAFDQVKSLMELNGTIVGAEALYELQHALEPDNITKLDPRIALRLRTSMTMSANNLLSLYEGRKRLSLMIEKELNGSVLIFPTVVCTAPTIESLENDEDLYTKTNLKVLRNTMMGSYLNMPSITLPTGKDNNGLPTSILLSLSNGQDDLLLTIASAVEREFK
jgi:aspartyl-tRNA(Asn)/glutamyl-tRNA(Gln) amidotransferase subunit A